MKSAVRALLFAVLAVCAAVPQATRKPLSRDEIVDLLKGHVPPTRVEELARRYGIAFEMTPETEDLLRKVGASEALLKTLRELASKRAAAAPNQQAGNPDAKVWVNTRAGVYHCPGTRWYGKTKQGEYMTQKQAQEKGYRPAYGKACK